MTSGTHIAEVQAALEALLAAGLSGGPKVDVRGLTGADFEEETSRLIVQPPAVLVIFLGETLGDPEAYGIKYKSNQNFTVIVGARDLRSESAERVNVLELLYRVCDALAGAKLQLASAAQRPLVVLGNVSLGQFDKDGTWYSLEVTVVSVALYSEKT